MRKILVSDYDDTFFVNEKDIRNNLKKLKWSFQKKWNDHF